MEEDVGIYRSEVMEIFGAFADISSDTVQILSILRDEEDEENDDEEVDT